MSVRNFLSQLYLIVVAMSICLTPGPGIGQTAVPMLINYQGALRTPATGELLADGQYDMMFQIYGVPSAGTPLWTGTYSAASGNPVEVTNGVFSVILGSGVGNALNPSVFDGADRWLAIEVRGEALLPRQRITSTAFSVVSENSRLLDGRQASAFADAAHTHVGDEIESFPWGKLTEMPAGFADGEDNDTTYDAGEGLFLNGAQFNVEFAGTGALPAAARADHNHGEQYSPVEHGHDAGDIVSGTLSPDRYSAYEDLTSEGHLDNMGETDLLTLGQAQVRFWSVYGNEAINPDIHFLGTLDGQPLELRVNGERALRLEPGPSPNVIGGYALNLATDGVMAATIGGGGESGFENRVTDSFGTISGGGNNQAGDAAGTKSDANFATVGGGHSNTAGAFSATVAGGAVNTANAPWAAIGGGNWNNVTDENGTIAGGNNNQAGDNAGTTDDEPFATVAGGYTNTAGGRYATVGGGHTNTARGFFATVGGGNNNTAGGIAATVAGGIDNTASGGHATVSGGSGNTASGDDSTCGGGYANTAGGHSAMVVGGFSNVANGAYSFAAGRRAKANHDGAFVWADSQDADIASTAAGQVTFRCLGGVRFTSGSGGTNQTVSWAPGGSSWTFSSDKNLKENFVEIDPKEVLERISNVSITEWNFKGYSQRHIGPVAQDFHALFPLGGSDTMIDSGDLQGVSLAAIQGLHEFVKEKDAEISTLKKQNADLESRVAALESLVEELAKERKGGDE